MVRQTWNEGDIVEGTLSPEVRAVEKQSKPSVGYQTDRMEEGKETQRISNLHPTKSPRKYLNNNRNYFYSLFCVAKQPEREPIDNMAGVVPFVCCYSLTFFESFSIYAFLVFISVLIFGLISGLLMTTLPFMLGLVILGTFFHLKTEYEGRVRGVQEEMTVSDSRMEEESELKVAKNIAARIIWYVLMFCNILALSVCIWADNTIYNTSGAAGQPYVRYDEMETSHSTVRYAMCNGQDFYTLDVVDIAYMTELSYLKEPTGMSMDCGLSGGAGNLKKCLDNYFLNYKKPSLNGGTYDWKVLDIYIPSSTSETHQVAFYGVWSKRANLIVVAVRGSTTGRDWLEDLALYSEVALLQLLSPMIYLWPYEATAVIVKALSYCSLFPYFEKDNNIDSSNYYEKVENYVLKLQNKYNGTNILLIGHSLGGATAQIVGARNNIRAFGFEPPGHMFSYGKFGITGGIKAIDNTLITVKRSNDPVTYIDTHGGQVQNILCKNTFIDFYCHLMHPITCHMMANCGALERESFDYWGGGLRYCGK